MREETLTATQTDRPLHQDHVDTLRRPPDELPRHVRTPFGSWTAIDPELGVPRGASLAIPVLVMAAVALVAVIGVVADRGSSEADPGPSSLAIDASPSAPDPFEVAEEARFEGLRSVGEAARDPFEVAEEARFEGRRSAGEAAPDSFDAAEGTRFEGLRAR